MRFKRGMARKIARRKTVRATLALRVADQAGNVRTASKRLRLRR